LNHEKKLFTPPGMAALLITTNSVTLSSSTEILLHKSPAQKLYGHPVQDSLFAHRHSFSQEWQCKAESAEQQAEAIQQFSSTYMLIPLQRLKLAPMLLSKILAPNFDGIVTAISPNCRYYIKTSSGRVLGPKPSLYMQKSSSVHTNIYYSEKCPADQKPQELHRSIQARQPPNRLIEYPTWN